MKEVVSEKEKSKLLEEYTIEEREHIPFLEKKKGDENLKEKDYEEAAKHYSKAVMAIKIFHEENKVPKEEIEKIIHNIGIPSNLNLSFIYINKKHWYSAIAHLNQVINYSPEHVKALYRRCLCFINSHQFENADKDLIALEYLIGGSQELEDLHTLFNEKKIEINKDEGNLYKKMFSQVSNCKYLLILSKRRKPI